jgi:membrane-associated HD superfamily phosphohydrolase
LQIHADLSADKCAVVLDILTFWWIGQCIFCFCRYHGRISFYQLLDIQRILLKLSRVYNILSLMWFCDLNPHCFHSWFIFFYSQGISSSILYLVNLKDLWESTGMFFFPFFHLLHFIQNKNTESLYYSKFKAVVCCADAQRRNFKSWLKFFSSFAKFVNYFSLWFSAKTCC